MKFQPTFLLAKANPQKATCTRQWRLRSLWRLAFMALILNVPFQNVFGQCTGVVMNISNPNPSRTVSGSTWTVPAGGPYKVKITAKGSRGGVAGNSGEVPGGAGATMIGEFILSSGQILRAVAGAPGSNTGGGGGSGVEIQGGNLLILAGAGGAGAFGGSPGQPGQTTTGSGNGGSGGFTTGGGGGGYYSSGNGIDGSGGGGGFAAVGGFYSPAGVYGGGGFGAGGSFYSGSGGGGGYDGGAGGTYGSGTSGGGSYNAGANQINTAGSNYAGGQVIIECLGAAAFTANFNATQPVCPNATQGSLGIDLTGDFNGNTAGLEYAIVSGSSFSGSPAFTNITADPLNLTSGFGTTGTATYTVRIRLKSNPSIFLDNTYTITQANCSPPPCSNLLAPMSGNGFCLSQPVGLIWASAPSATSYDVYFGTSNPPPFLLNTASTLYAPTGLTAGTYYWQIRPKNANGAATGCSVWNFTVLPDPVGNLFSNPIVIPSLPYTTTGDNLASNCWTSEFGNASPDVFYQFTNTACQSQVTISLCGSGFDTVLRLLDASGTHIAFSDDSQECNLQSFMQVNLSAGTYYIVVEGFTSNTGNYNLSVTASDITPPSFPFCLGNQVVQANSVCEAALPNFPASGLVAIDNCPGVSTTQSPLPLTTISGTTVVTITGTDASNNQTTCTFSVTVVDNIAPTITCPANQTVVLNANNCSAVIGSYAALAMASDNCTNPPTITQMPSAGTVLNGAGTTQQVRLTARDAANLTTFCTFNVTAVDQTAPTITCPANISQAATPGQCSANVTFANATATDNCTANPTILNLGTASGSSFPFGTTQVTFRAIDNSSNQSTCSFNVMVTAWPETCDNIDNDCNGTVDDGIASTPCIAPGTPPGLVYNDVFPASQCQKGQSACVNGIIVCQNFVGPSTEACDATDNDCDAQVNEGFTDTDGDTIADCVDPDDDNDGIVDMSDNCPVNANTAQNDSDNDGIGDACDPCTLPYITLPDNGSATVACPSMATQPTPPVGTNQFGAPVTPTGPVVVRTPDPVTCEGTVNFTWNYADCNGVNHPWSYTYTIERNDFAVPANGAATVACESAITTPTPPTVQSNCGETITPTGPVTSASPTCEGLKVYTWTYADCEGNSHAWNFVYTIERSDFTVPANGAATVACPSAITTPVPPTVTSDCGEAITPTGPVIGATPACEGTKTYTWTYTDCEGNTHPWVFTYTIERNDFTVPANGSATVACAAAITTPVPPTVTSNCGEAITPTGPVIGATPACEGTKTYTWTYTDCEGNAHDWTFTYTIERNDFAVPANGAATVACPSAITTPVPPTVTSDCGEAITPTGPVIGATPACEGTKTYTWTYTDCEGNTHPWVFTYTIERNDFAVPANGSATVACASAITTPVPPTVTSDCGEAITPTGPVIGATPACEGTKTYTWTYTDCEGNAHDWTFTYTIERNDFTMPVNGTATVSCPALATQPVPPTVTSNCGEAITPTGPVIGATPACEGVKTYTWTYTDCEGNAHDWTFTYTIERNDFAVPANGAVTVACPALATAPTPPVVQSNCGETLAPTLIVTNAPNPLTCEGTRTYAYTYTDCEGNTATWSHVYTIERNTFTIPANPAAVTVACPANATQPTPPVVNSDCGEAITPTGPVIVNTPNPLTCEGTRTYAWTYTDCEGYSHTWTFTYIIERNDFAVPANGGTTVACPANATQPVPPVVLSNCGETITPSGPVVANMPSLLTCEGTRTYTWTYTDCEGNAHPWSFTYTIERNDFALPANGGSTVNCAADTDVVPTPPTVTSGCGEVLVPVVTASAKPGCEGTRVYTFRYTDCEGNFHDWLYFYQVERLDFLVPPSEMVTVECPINVVQPTPPTIHDNCGKLLVPSLAMTSTNNGNGCEASRTYSFTYTDCEGNTHVWSKTFQFLYTADFFTFSDQEDVVGCLLYAQAPIPPTLYDNCGQQIAVSGPVVEEHIEQGGCAGTRKFTFTYTDCGGHSHDWSFSYTANDQEPPVGQCPSGASNVDERGLQCIGDVPCPEDYDFGPKIEQLLAKGDFYDLCSGSELVVTLDSWTELWDCADAGGNGDYTFGRTFYFQIADPCGNQYPSLCAVTYSGVCQPLETFPQAAWGIAGGTPGNTVPGANGDMDVIQSLLEQSPLIIGGGNRSLTVTQAQCIVDLLPGNASTGPLANCHQTNCSANCNPMGVGGMKNGLAANAIATLLNLRYNVRYNGLVMDEMLAQGLGCLDVNTGIVVCTNASGDCLLRVWDQLGVSHEFPYTLGGLLDLTNLYLGGNISLQVAQSQLYAAQLNDMLTRVNGYWSEAQPQATCSTDAGAAPLDGGNKSLSATGKANGGVEKAGFGLAPNPAGSSVTLTLTELDGERDVTFELYNQVGQLLLRKDFGAVNNINERLDISALRPGLYIASVKVGGERFEQKLMVGND